MGPLTSLVDEKMRRSIMTHLKSRSEAIRSAIKTYNNAADSANPKRDRLDPDDVLQYSYIGQFDVLRDTRNAITEKPWAVPANRIARDAWYKTERAKEEIVRAEVEVARLQSWMEKEEDVFNKAVDGSARENPLLSEELRRRLKDLRQVHGRIRKDLARIRNIPDYTPSFKLTHSSSAARAHGDEDSDSDAVDVEEAAASRLDDFLDAMTNVDGLG